MQPPGVWLRSLRSSSRREQTSSIAATGCMKWVPMTCSGRSVIDARCVIEIDDVLDPMIASGLSAGQSAANIWRFASSFSVAASMTMSQSRKSAVLPASVFASTPHRPRGDAVSIAAGPPRGRATRGRIAHDAELSCRFPWATASTEECPQGK